MFDCRQAKPSSHFWIHFTVIHHARIQLDGPQVLPAEPLFPGLLSAIIAEHRAHAGDLRDQRLYHLASALVHLALARLSVPLSNRLPGQLAELLDLIHNSPHGDLSNIFLAERMGMGVERFIRWFREHMGQTPAAYVSESRVRMAREALALTDKSIDQIAVEFGFPNRHYLSRVFARVMGCGPAEFRKRQRERKGL